MNPAAFRDAWQMFKTESTADTVRAVLLLAVVLWPVMTHFWDKKGGDR